MNVIFRGGSPHRYSSAPSGRDYRFFPGVPLTVESQDEEFFKGNPDSWEIEHAAETIAKAVVKTVSKIGKGGKK